MEHFIIRTTVRYRIQSKDTMLYKEDSNVCRCTYLRSFSIRHLNCSSFLQHIGALSFTIRHEFQTFLIYQQVQLLILEHQHPYFVVEGSANTCYKGLLILLWSKHKQLFTTRSFKVFIDFGVS